MSYAVKELSLTIQGEGAQAGRVAVFLRFAGCNLWSGREADRSEAACRFCDTDFVGIDGINGGRFDSAESLAGAVAGLWPNPPRAGVPYVVCTGGEPLLQLDAPLVGALHDRGFEVAVETNGTLPVPPGVDWVCVSPKAGADLVQRRGNELKLIHPQAGAEPERFEGLAFDRFYVQPMDGPNRARNTEQSIAFCLANPGWRLSVQSHKYVGIR